MRSIKTAGLLAVLALAVMAFVGAASASATTIRSGSASGPAYSGPVAGKLDSHSPHNTGSGTAELRSSSGNIVCTTSDVGGSVNSNGTGSITSLTFTNSGGNCTTTISGCPTATVTVNNLPYNVTAAFVTGQLWDGTLTVYNPDVTIVLHCLLNVSCHYTASSVGGNLYNPNNASRPATDPGAAVDFQATLNSTSGFPCPSTGVWHATYILKGSVSGSPVDLWITA